MRADCSIGLASNTNNLYYKFYAFTSIEHAITNLCLVEFGFITFTLFQFAESAPHEVHCTQGPPVFNLVSRQYRSYVLMSRAFQTKRIYDIGFPCSYDDYCTPHSIVIYALGFVAIFCTCLAYDKSCSLRFVIMAYDD